MQPSQSDTPDESAPHDPSPLCAPPGCNTRTRLTGALLAAFTATAAAGPARKCDVAVSGNIMILGGELPNMPVKHDSWDDCCKMCWQDEQYKDACARVSFNLDTKDCWLHDHTGGSVVNSLDDNMFWCGYPANQNPAYDCKHYPKLGEQCSYARQCCGPGNRLTCDYKDGINKAGTCESQAHITATFPIWEGILE